jgi:hypothetical protein
LSASAYQFHARNQESVDLLLEAAKKYRVYVTCMFEQGVRLIEPDALAGDRPMPAESPEPQWICLTMSSPNLKWIDSDFLFVDSNPDRLSILLGGETPTEIRESMLQYTTDEPNSTTWRRIAQAMRRKLRKGGWIYSPNQDAKRLLKSALFGEQASALSVSGAKELRAGRTIYLPGIESTDPRLLTASEG